MTDLLEQYREDIELLNEQCEKLEARVSELRDENTVRGNECIRLQSLRSKAYESASKALNELSQVDWDKAGDLFVKSCVTKAIEHLLSARSQS